MRSSSPVIAAKAGQVRAAKLPGGVLPRAISAMAATMGTRASARVRLFGLIPWPVRSSEKNGPASSSAPPRRVRGLMGCPSEPRIARWKMNATSAAAAQPVEAERSVVPEVGRVALSAQRVAARRQSRAKGHQAFQRG